MQNELKEELGIGTDLLTDNASFKDDLAVDSLDLIELQMEVEKQYSLNMAEEEAENLKTVGGLIAYVKEKRR
jgi:acyl carrier protein